MRWHRIFPLIFVFVAVLPAGADEVSWSPPAVYAEKFQPLLTPVEPLRKAKPSPNEEDRDGVVLVDEDLQIILADGRRILVEHFAGLAVTDSGAESLGRTERRFHKSRHRPHLALAHTILPDGKKQAVKKDGAFFQTPQDDADAALYDDSTELVIIFPGVKAGCVVEWVTVSEETKGRIPGEYTALYDMAGGWPVRKLVRRVEMPDAIAQRLRLTPLGTGVPEPARSSKDGQTTLLWERSNVSAMPSETDPAPFDQTGPCVFLTTLPDWSAFLRWYVPLADRRMVAGDKLKSLADEWTKDAKSPREIIDIITAKVTNDVRYVGLEFNDCDLEPHPAEEVWEHQYGDCKDKAALLCTLLRHKGLTAHMALVNTEHLGRVERRSPDFRHFNHAIAVAQLPDGPLFIDPTISGAPAGMLSDGDTDRDVLLVKEPEQWLRTPAQRSGSYSLDFDAALAADGSLSGWVTLRADGYVGTLYADYERTGSKDQLRRRLTRQAESRWQGARVVDVKPSVRDAATGRYEVSGYFTVPAAGSLTLGFPYPIRMLPDPGDTDARETDLMVWLENRSTTSTINLPAGYGAVLPGPFVIDSPFAEGRAAWEKTEKGLKAVLDYRAKTARIPAGDVAAFGRMLAPLRAWLTKPLTITVSDKAQAETSQPAGGDGLENFPVMPSGEGQLNLVDEKFPDGGNQSLRRKAFEKTIALFPQDAATQFKATVQLAWMDVQEKAPKEALRRLKAPLETGRGAVSVEDVGFAEYTHALALRGDDQKTEALALLDRMAAQEDLSEFRRSWVQYQRAFTLTEADRDKAIAALHTGIGLATGNEGSLLEALADFRLEKGEGETFTKELHAWLDKKPANAGAVLTELAGTVASWIASEPRHAAALLAILNSTGDAKRFGEEYAAALDNARTAVQTAAAGAGIAEQLKKFLDEHPELLPAADVPEDLDEPDAFLEAFKKVTAQDTGGGPSTRWALEFLRRFPPGGNFYEMLRKAVAFENWREENAAKTKPGLLLQQLLALGDRLPKSHDEYLECRFLRSAVLSRTGKPEEALKILMGIGGNREIDAGFRISAFSRAGEGAVQSGNAEAALRAWQGLKDFPNAYATADGFFKAALLELERGHAGEAKKWIGDLRALSAGVIAKCPLAAAIGPFLKFTEDMAAAEKWWAFSAAWWPEWERIEKKLGHKPVPGSLIVPAIASVSALGTEIAEASRSGNRAESAAGLSLLAHAARWDPLMALEIIGLGASLPTFGLQDHLQEYSKFCLAVSAEAAVQPESMRRKFLYHRILARMNLRDYEPVFAEAAAFRAMAHEPDALDEVTARFRAMAAAAAKKEMAASAAEMEKYLAANAFPPDRDRNITFLADLYAGLGRTEDEIALVTRSLEEPDIKSKKEAHAQFTARLEKLRGAGDLAAGVTSAINNWFAAHRPAWLETALPLKIQDRKDAGDLEEQLGISSEVPETEAFKLATLVAADASQSVEHRSKALEFLAYRCVKFAPDEKIARAWTAALVENKSLPINTRGTVFYYTLMGAWDEEAFPFAHWLLQQPAYAAHRTKLLDTTVVAVCEFCELPPADLDAAEAAAKKMLGRPLNAMSGLMLPRLAGRLAAGGRMEAARKLAAAVPGAKCEEKFEEKKSGLQLGMTKVLNRIAELSAAHEALRSWWMKEFPASHDPAPEVFQRKREPNLDEPAMLAHLDRLVRDSSFDPTDLGFWLDVMRDMPGDAARRDARRVAMLRLMVEHCMSDAERGRVVVMASLACDMDEAGVVKEVLAALAPLRKLTSAPQTADALRWLDLAMQLRRGEGQPADWRLALQSLKGPMTLGSARMHVLASIFAREDMESLREFLSTAPLTLLTDEYFIGQALKAWRAAGMKEEEEIGSAKAREMVAALITSAWAFADSGDASRAVEIAASLNDPALVSPAFVSAMQQSIMAPRDRARFTARAAVLRSDWEAARAAAATVVAARPMDYHMRLMLGRALVKLGRKDEAVPHLKAFIEKSPDEIEWPEAKELLKAAETP